MAGFGCPPRGVIERFHAFHEVDSFQKEDKRDGHTLPDLCPSIKPTLCRALPRELRRHRLADFDWKSGVDDFM